VVYVAVHVTDAPAASVLMMLEFPPQLIADSPAMGSVTATLVNVTEPVFVTV
jgi:hypothetical protein